MEPARVVEAAAPAPRVDANQLLLLAREEELRGELGRAYGLLVEVIEEYRETLDPSDPALLPVLADLARLGYARGNKVAADQWLRESRELVSDLGAEAYLAQLRELLALGRLHRVSGDPERAAQLCSEVLPGLERELGQDAPLVVDVRVELADLLLGLDRDAEAEPHLRVALAVAEAHGGKRHVDTLHPRRALAVLASDAEDWDAAYGYWTAVVVTERDVLGKGYAGLADSRYELARSLEGRGKITEAKAVYRDALADYRANGGGGAPEFRALAIQRKLGRLSREQEQFVEAKDVLAKALAEARETLGPVHTETLRCLDELVLVLVDTNQLKQARELALEAMRATPANTPERRARKERAAALSPAPEKAAGGNQSPPSAKQGPPGAKQSPAGAKQRPAGAKQSPAGANPGRGKQAPQRGAAVQGGAGSR